LKNDGCSHTKATIGKKPHVRNGEDLSGLILDTYTARIWAEITLGTLDTVLGALSGALFAGRVAVHASMAALKVYTVLVGVTEFWIASAFVNVVAAIISVHDKTDLAGQALFGSGTRALAIASMMTRRT
jgi:hypothetical protein